MAKTVIICGKLFDGLGDTTLGPTEILIEGETIVEISNSVGRPDGANVLDLSDRTVSPGFIDTHIHLCVDGLNLARQTLQCSPAKALAGLHYAQQYMRFGFTTLRDARSLEHCYLIEDEGVAMAEKAGAFLVPTMQMTREDKAHLVAGKLPEHAVWKFRRDVAVIEDAQRRIARSNAKVAFGTDCGMFPFSEGVLEFQAMVAAGLAPARAMKAGTSVAAELYPQLQTCSCTAPSDALCQRDKRL